MAKTEAQLQKSYEAQKKLFDTATQKKVLAIQTQIDLKKAEIQTLNGELEILNQALKGVSERSFRTFEDYKKQAQENSQKSPKS